MRLSMIQKINHGDIWLANLNPNKGKEPGKTRPVLIIQNQVLLDEFHPTTLIIPLTSKLIDNAEPLRVRINAQSELKEDSDFLIDQLRAIDNQRLIKGPIAHCTKKLMKKVYESIQDVIGTLGPVVNRP